MACSESGKVFRGSATKVYHIVSVTYEVAFISLRVVTFFSRLLYVPANSVFEKVIIWLVLCMYMQINFAFVPQWDTSPGRFRLTLLGNPRHWGRSWMGVVNWFFFFRHGVFPSVKSNRVKNAPCDVAVEILLNIIHTHQFKIRQKQ